MSTPDNSDAAFVARVTASTTHEIRNVLAIVKESAGLIDDMLGSVEQGVPLKFDKVKRAVGRIEAQVNRGAELMTSLNRFAHTLDPTDQATDLNTEVEQAVFLYQRFARQKDHTVQAADAGRDVTCRVDAFRLQLLLFRALECCSEQVPQGGTITIGVGRLGQQPSLDFTGTVGDKALPLTPTETSGASRFMEALDRVVAVLEAAAGAPGFQVRLPE